MKYIYIAIFQGMTSSTLRLPSSMIHNRFQPTNNLRGSADGGALEEQYSMYLTNIYL